MAIHGALTGFLYAYKFYNWDAICNLLTEREMNVVCIVS